MPLFKTIPNHLPYATGPFVPGYTDVMVGYNKDGFLVRLYYPTNVSRSDKENHIKWKCWLPDNSYANGLSKVLMVFPFMLRMLMWWTDYIRIPAPYGENPKLDKKLKCIIFSHGLGGNRFLYSNVCCELASRGYLVAAIEHREHSASNTYFYTSKEMAERNERSTVEFKHIPFDEKHFEKRQEQVLQRAAECSKVIDFLINLNRGVVPHNTWYEAVGNLKLEFSLEDFVDKIDVDSLTMMGHSFGGATALLALSQRHELKQGILLDPWMFPIKNFKLYEKLLQPLLFINTQTFHIKANVNAMEKYLNDDVNRKMHTILHTTHEHQTDSVLLIGAWLNLCMKKLNSELALKINNSLIVTYLSEYHESPTDIQDCQELLIENKNVVEFGLTRPWA